MNMDGPNWIHWDFVAPLHKTILARDYTRIKTDEGRRNFLMLRAALVEVDEPLIAQLLAARNWRHRITASWFCGVKNWSHFADQLGNLMVKSEVCFAGRGYAFALARFADDTSIHHLTNYLDIYLRRRDLGYDQYEVFWALMWIDEQKGSHHAERYLVPGGLWETFTAGRGGDDDYQKRRFFYNMEFCRRGF